MQCRKCCDMIDDPIMEMFLCSTCRDHYCFYCTNAYYEKDHKFVQFSDSKAPLESLDFGYNNVRNLKDLSTCVKFYCESCVKYITLFDPLTKRQHFMDNNINMLKKMHSMREKLISKYECLDQLSQKYHKN